MVNRRSDKLMQRYMKCRPWLLCLMLGGMLILSMFSVFCSNAALANEERAKVSYDRASDSLTVEARGLPLTTVLARIAELSAVEILVAPGIEKKISIKINGLSLEEGLKRITRGLSHAMVFSEGEGKGAKPLLISIKIIPKGPSDGSNAVPVGKLAAGEMKSNATVSDAAGNTLKRERKVLSVEEKETRKKERNKRRMERIRSKLEKEEEFVESDLDRYAKREKQRARMRQQLDELAEE